MVSGILQNEGIAFIMKKNEINMFVGLKENLDDESWGKIFVDEGIYNRAYEIIRGYFQSLKEDADA